MSNLHARDVDVVDEMWAPDEPGADRCPRWTSAAGRSPERFRTGKSSITCQVADESERRVRATYCTDDDRAAEGAARYVLDDPYRGHRDVGPGTPGAQ